MEPLKASIVIPAHNEAGTIREVVERAFAALEMVGGGEVIVVDDGSSDDTPAILRELNRPGLVVLRHRRNVGLSAALGTGFRGARGARIFFLCADMQCDPIDAVPRMNQALTDGAEIVFGYRDSRHEMKSFASAGYRLLCRLLFGVGLKDMNWVKGFRREVVDTMILRPGWHRFLAVLAVREGFRYAEVETRYLPRTYGKSHFGVWRIPQSIMHMLALKFHITFSAQPLLLFGIIGTILLLLACGGISYYLAAWLISGEKYRQLLFPIVVFALSGLQFILMGFLAETLAHILHVIRDHRPS